MAEPRMRLRQKGQQFPSQDSTLLPTTSLPLTPNALLTIVPSRGTPLRLRRSRPPPEHNHSPRRNNHRLCNRDMPRSGFKRVLLAPPKDQSRRLQVGVEAGSEEVGQGDGDLHTGKSAQGE